MTEIELNLFSIDGDSAAKTSSIAFSAAALLGYSFSSPFLKRAPIDPFTDNESRRASSGDPDSKALKTALVPFEYDFRDITINRSITKSIPKIRSAKMGYIKTPPSLKN